MPAAKASGELPSPGAFGTGVLGEGGCEWGTLQSCACGGQEAVPCAYIPPACQPRKSQLLRLPGAAKGSAVLAEAPQRRSKREPPESLRTLRLGVLLPALPTTSWSPSSAFRNGVGCVSTEVNIHWSLWLFSWHRVRREAGTAHRSGEPARPPPASAPSA